MLHTKLRGNRSTGSGEEDFLMIFTIYGCSDHLGHVTSIMFMDFHLLVPESLQTEFGQKWPSSFQENQVLISICKCPGAQGKKK